MAEKKVLIVDTDPQSLDVLAKLLRVHRVLVIKASDGQAAFEKYKAEKPDVVILEALLPKIHGFDLAKKINQDSLGQVPVIIVTGLYRGAQYRHEALSSFGATDYFEKPVDAERFTATMKQLLHEDEDIDDPLPDSNAIIESLSHWIRGNYGNGADSAAAAEKGNNE